jgi:hypothetical protein
MSKKYLVICPSNQSYNPYPRPAGWSEMTAMVKLANLVVEAARDVEGLTVVSIPGRPDDGRDPLLSALDAQLDAAATWLQVMGVSLSDGVILSIHSDSGESHLANCYGGAIGGPSWQLGECVMESVQALMRTPRLIRLDYTYYRFYQRRRGYVATLFECGAHRDERDLRFLVDRQEKLAKAILAGVLGYFGLPLHLRSEDRTSELGIDPVAQFEARGIGANKETAIYKFYREACRGGLVSNLGAAITDEIDGEKLQIPKPGVVVQYFQNGVVEYHTDTGKCFRPLICEEPNRWFPIPS